MNQHDNDGLILTPEQVHDELRGILLELEEYFRQATRLRVRGESPTPRPEDLILAGLSEAYVLGLVHGRRQLTDASEELREPVIRLEDL